MYAHLSILICKNKKSEGPWIAHLTCIYTLFQVGLHRGKSRKHFIMGRLEWPEADTLSHSQRIRWCF